MNVAYLAPEFGALSSTFVYREIEALRDAGLEVSTLSTRRPRDSVFSGEAADYMSETAYLYDIGVARLLSHAFQLFARRPVHFMRCLSIAAHDAVLADVRWPSDRVKLFWHFLMGCAAARVLQFGGCTHLHAHFAHVPASIAMYGAMLAEVPFSFTAHANDLFERGTALREKVNRASFVACISEFNRRFLIEKECPPEKLHVVHCGVDLEDFPLRDPKPFASPPSLSLVARLIEKKGIRYLIDALKILRERDVAFHCTIVGEGLLEEEIRHDVRTASLIGTVHIMGGQPQEMVREIFHNTDVFVLPCVPARSGDLDGIPVVLIEAMALGVPVISTDVSGIPELIQSGTSGILVPPKDAYALADAIQSLLENPELARRYAEAGRRKVESEFEIARNAGRLIALFQSSALNRTA